MPVLDEDKKQFREDELDLRAQEMFNYHPDLQSESTTAPSAEEIRDGINQAEQAANNTNSSQPWTTSVSKNTPSQESSRAQQLKARLKKGGPIAGLGGGLFGIFFGISTLLSPALAIVHLKEVITGDLNDQVAALDVRSAHVFKAKLNNLGKKYGTCTIAKIRCGLSGMSDRQIKNFEKAGIKVTKVEPESKSFGKNAVASLEFSDGTKISNQADIKNLTLNKTVRSNLRKAYNPIFYGAWDKTAGKVFKLHNQSKASVVTGSTDEERDKSLKQSIQGERTNLQAANISSSNSDDEKANTEAEERRNDAKANIEEVTKSSGAGSLLKGGLKGVSIIGAADTACTVYNTSRMVESGAKLIRSTQLLGFALAFLNFADKVKAGDATADEAEYFGNKLTAVDTREMIVNETSKNENTEVKNPYYQKNAFDSEGFKTAQYNEAPKLTAQAQQFMVGGALVGTLSTVNNAIAKVIGGDREAARKTCKTVQNPFVRTAGFIVGIISGVASGGGTLAASVAGSLAVAAALPILTGYLKDIVSGTTVTADTDGPDAGNAIFSGSGVLLGNIAQARGMQPATKESLQAYQNTTLDVKNSIIASEINDAKDTPFDVMNQYSFAGIATRKLLPYTQSSAAIAGSYITNIPKLFSSILSTPTQAYSNFNSDRFSRCEDDGYKELGIDADIFCNIRYSMSPKELAMGTDDVYTYMTTGGHVDSDTGDALSDEYKDFLAECVDRSWGWGDASSEEGDDYGSSCLDKGKNKDEIDKLSHFRVYTMDRSIEDGMDNGPEEESGTETASQAATTFTVGSYNMCHEVSHPDCPSDGDKISNITSVINGSSSLGNPTMDIVGTQETTIGALKSLKSTLKDYDSFPEVKDLPTYSGKAILWNTARFNLVDSGLVNTLNVDGQTLTVVGNGENKINPDYNSIVWVKLQSTEGQTLYVTSTHSPNDDWGGSMGGPGSRFNNAKILRKWAEEKSSDGSLVIHTGDFNNGTKSDGGNPGLYCYLTKDDLMIHARDLMNSKAGQCPGDNVPIDSIYITNNTAGISANNWGHLNSDKAGTDHSPAYVTLSTSTSDGSSSSSSASGFFWPVDKKYFQNNPSDFLGSHIETGTAWGADNMGTSGKGGGIASDIGDPPDGSNVYAMLGGKVTSTNLCGSSDGVAIKSTVNGKTVGIAYMHGTNQTVKVGDTVNAGAKIMNLGTLGCSVKGGHVHIGIAYDGKYVCPQDIFKAMSTDSMINWNTLVSNATTGCKDRV